MLRALAWEMDAEMRAMFVFACIKDTANVRRKYCELAHGIG